LGLADLEIFLAVCFDLISMYCSNQKHMLKAAKLSQPKHGQGDQIASFDFVVRDILFAITSPTFLG
jgi:hypothetical protein